ncbi:uncharacterized protein LOC116039861 [Sander lucioperca]|uniref:uncharacterized protein LOC116039861 n=1 Tax=Sander lucioperca TaxID=283035 RepID=UPI00125DE2FD|nr:uncharacterized protein LOC116039861 [Sander lucioperca]
MALQKVLSERPQTPYSRPPPLHVTVVAMKDERRVVSWGFDDESGEAKAVLMKENRLVILSDGCSLSKATLFEAFAGRVSLGGAYIMRGYSLRGEGPPFGINITKETQFFRSAPVEVSEELRASAENLLCPASTPTATKDIKSQQGFLTLQGEVVEISAVKKVKVGKDMVPLKTVVLEQDKAQVSISLWREAALFSFGIGDEARLTHLKGYKSSYGYRVQSTNFTVCEETDSVLVVSALGTIEVEGKEGMLKLLIEGEQVYDIEEDLWTPLQREMVKLPFYIKITVKGKRVTKAEVVKGEV